MRQNHRICHRVHLRAPKQLDAFALREEAHIEGTPRIIIGKQLPGGVLELWTDELRTDSLHRLRELNSSERAFGAARRVLLACVRLAERYGCFILNENMVFMGPHSEVLVWINSDVLENRVKIYLPGGSEGEQAMLRSIVTFLKLWLRFDHLYLSSAWSLDDLLVKFEAVRARALDRPQASLSKLANERPSLNFEEESVLTLKAIRSKNQISDQAKENRIKSKLTVAVSS